MSDSEDEDEIPHYSPNLSEKLIPPTQFQKIHEWNILKKSSAKIRGKTNFHSKILNFTNPKFFPKIPLAQITRKKVRDFCKASRWKVNGNEHAIFNYIIDPVGNDFFHMRILKYTSLTISNVFHLPTTNLIYQEKGFLIVTMFFFGS